MKILAHKRLAALAALGKHEFGPPDGLIAYLNHAIGFDGKPADNGKTKKWTYQKKFNASENIKLVVQYAEKPDGRSSMSFEGVLDLPDGGYMHLTGRPFNSDVAVDDLKRTATAALRNTEASPKSESMRILQRLATGK